MYVKKRNIPYPLLHRTARRGSVGITSICGSESESLNLVGVGWPLKRTVEQ